MNVSFDILPPVKAQLQKQLPKRKRKKEADREPEFEDQSRAIQGDLARRLHRVLKRASHQHYREGE